MRTNLLGFTLIEVVISLACLALILGVSVPAYDALQVRNDLGNTTAALVSNLRRAQVLARAANGDTSWGVYIATGSILIYKGSGYNMRDTLYDENTSISPTILVSGLLDVNFTKVHGLPNIAGTTTLTSVRNETRTIIINKKGTINH